MQAIFHFKKSATVQPVAERVDQTYTVTLYLANHIVTGTSCFSSSGGARILEQVGPTAQPEVIW